MSARPRVIDAHHHLWRYTADEFGWIEDSMALLRRDFLPVDFAQELDTAGVDGAIVVQARQSLDETRWLCEQAASCPRIRGVVGWAPIAAPEFADVLAELKQSPQVVGLRHIVQAEAPGFLDRDAFHRGMELMKEVNYTFDLLVFERQLEEAIRFVDRHPDQRFVLDHIGKPKIAAGELEPWRTYMQALALRPNVMCKVSGMVTEADWATWTLETLRPYLDVCMETFGPARLMAGSDWPVCLVATGYAKWWSTLRTYFAGCSEQEQDAVFGGNATRFYSLD